MDIDPRSELFKRVINLVDNVNLEDVSLELFTKEKAQEILEKLEGSKSPDEDLFDMLMFTSIEEDCEKNGPFEVADISKERYGLDDVPENSSNIIKCIGYLNDLIERFANGEVATMTAVSLLKDGRSAIWIPNGFRHDKVDEVFDPVIEELKYSEPNMQVN